MLNSMHDIETPMQMMDAYKAKLQQLKDSQSRVNSNGTIWNEIDSIVSPLTEEQKGRLLEDEEYVDTYNKIQALVQSALLDLVKTKIENTPEGKELLQNQLGIVKRLKKKILNDTDNELKLFNRFREFSKKNPGITYEEFLKNNN